MGYSALRADRLYKFLGLALTLDLSETGLRVRTNEPLPLGEELSFSLKLGGEMHNLRGRVLWGSEIEANKTYEFGIRFKSIDLGLARDLWKLAERALDSGPVSAVQTSVDAVDQLAKALTQETGEPLGENERDVLRRAIKRAGLQPNPERDDDTEPFEPGGNRRPLLVGQALPHAAGGKGSADDDDSSEITLQLGSFDTHAYRERMPTPIRGAVVPSTPGRLLEFLELLGTHKKTGVLEIASDKGSGHLAIRDGLVVAARTTQNARGEPAVHELLRLADVRFDFWPHRLSCVETEHELPIAGLIAAHRPKTNEPGLTPRPATDSGFMKKTSPERAAADASGLLPRPDGKKTSPERPAPDEDSDFLPRPDAKKTSPERPAPDEDSGFLPSA